MPLGKYFDGEGKKVMRKMKAHYGDDEGQRVFYATANKRKSLAGGSKRRMRRKGD